MENVCESWIPATSFAPYSVLTALNLAELVRLPLRVNAANASFVDRTQPGCRSKSWHPPPRRNRIGLQGLFTVGAIMAMNCAPRHPRKQAAIFCPSLRDGPGLDCRGWRATRPNLLVRANQLLHIILRIVSQDHALAYSTAGINAHKTLARITTLLDRSMTCIVTAPLKKMSSSHRFVGYVHPYPAGRSRPSGADVFNSKYDLLRLHRFGSPAP